MSHYCLEIIGTLLDVRNPKIYVAQYESKSLTFSQCSQIPSRPYSKLTIRLEWRFSPSFLVHRYFLEPMCELNMIFNQIMQLGFDQK